MSESWDCAEKKLVMDVFCVSWLPEDHIEELCKVLKDASVDSLEQCLVEYNVLWLQHVIFPDASVDSLEQCLVEYVVDSIEPAGWRAVWRPDPIRTPPGAFRHNYAFSDHQEYIVEVHDVNLEKLEAKVQIVSSASDFVAKLKTFPKQPIPEGVQGVETNKEIPPSETRKREEGTDNACLQFKSEKKTKRRDRKPTSVIITETKVLGSSSLVNSDVPMNESEMAVDEQCDSDSAQNTATKKPMSSRIEECSDHLRRALSESAGVKLADETIVRARVWELTPLVEQENHVLDVETTAEVTALVRFFYEHIFYPWDAVAEFCCYDDTTVADRHLLLSAQAETRYRTRAAYHSTTVAAYGGCILKRTTQKVGPQKRGQVHRKRVKDKRQVELHGSSYTARESKQAGSKQAGSKQAGSKQAGSKQAGSKQAGTHTPGQWRTE
ncbi:hypothetical protein FHG87_004931 [Trinorchestia longiramus]|nr:hypothetical protein FHG87_004931 [Trinorchestia longiramus]